MVCEMKKNMQSTFEDDTCCVSNIIVYDKVSDDFIFLSIKGTCPNQNLVAHHQFLDNLPGKAFETHWQFTGILIIYNGRHAKSKYLNIATSVEIFRTRFSRPLKLIFFQVFAIFHKPSYTKGLWKIAKIHNHLAKFSVKNDPGK